MNQAPPLRDEWLGTTDAAAVAGYSHWRWRKLVSMGKAPKPVRINGKLLWRRSLLDAYMRALEVEQGVIPPTAA
jgi:predicted DNA-binding transcriptional regulator AlpA